MRRAAAALAVLSAVALTGCSGYETLVVPMSLRTDVELTPAQARAELADQQDRLQDFLGGTWVEHDDPIATSCSDGRGFYYDGFRNRDEPVTDRAASADAVATWFTEQGYAVSRAKYGDDYVIAAEAENGTSLSLFLYAYRTSIAADGPCVPGDAGKISDDDLARVRKESPDPPTSWPGTTSTPRPTGRPVGP